MVRIAATSSGFGALFTRAPTLLAFSVFTISSDDPNVERNSTFVSGSVPPGSWDKGRRAC